MARRNRNAQAQVAPKDFSETVTVGTLSFHIKPQMPQCDITAMLGQAFHYDLPESAVTPAELVDYNRYAQSYRDDEMEPNNLATWVLGKHISRIEDAAMSYAYSQMNW